MDRKLVIAIGITVLSGSIAFICFICIFIGYILKHCI